MFAAAFALLVVGYAAVYSGASNLFSGGGGWGFLQSLLNKGANNAMTGMDSLITGSQNSGGGIVPKDQQKLSTTPNTNTPTVNL